MMTEVPIMPLWVTVFLTIWAPVGPLVGILIGHYLSRSWQRRQWVADHRLQEWRELIETLINSFSTIVLVGNVNSLRTIENIKAGHDADVAAIQTMGNRVFINKDLEKEKIVQQWTKATGRFKQDKDEKTFEEAFSAISVRLKEMAYHDIEKI